MGRRKLVPVTEWCVVQIHQINQMQAGCYDKQLPCHTRPQTGNTAYAGKAVAHHCTLQCRNKLRAEHRECKTATARQEARALLMPFIGSEVKRKNSR